MPRWTVLALAGPLLVLARPDALHAQKAGKLVNILVTVPVQVSNLHPDLAAWQVSCQSPFRSQMAGRMPSGTWPDGASGWRPIVGGSIQDSVVISFRDYFEPSRPSVSIPITCRVYGRLSAGARAPTDGRPRERVLAPTETDARFRTTADAAVSVTATVPPL